MRNVFVQARQKVFPAFFGGSQHVPGYQRFWTVYPEISAGYVGVSRLSLEFVHADKSRLTPSFVRRDTCKEIHKC